MNIDQEDHDIFDLDEDIMGERTLEASGTSTSRNCAPGSFDIFAVMTDEDDAHGPESDPHHQGQSQTTPVLGASVPIGIPESRRPRTDLDDWRREWKNPKRVEPFVAPHEYAAKTYEGDDMGAKGVLGTRPVPRRHSVMI